MIWVFHLLNIYSAWKATLLTKNMEEGKNRQYLANYLHDNSDSENIQDANIKSLKRSYSTEIYYGISSYISFDFTFVTKEYQLTAQSLEKDITILSADNHNCPSM